MSGSEDRPDLAELIDQLTTLRDEMSALADQHGALPGDLDLSYRESARNLLHYLALRRHDLRPLQMRLAALGLSSLGRAESHSLAAVDAVIGVMLRLSGGVAQPLSATGCDMTTGRLLLDSHTRTLLGANPPGRSVHIMVTASSEMADDYALVRDLLTNGMNCLRINCAHDDAAAWERMIGHLRRAERELGVTCKVFMDLAGPKLRTGPVEPGPAVVKVRPKRSQLGQVTAAARVWLTAGKHPTHPNGSATAVITVPAHWLASLSEGNRISFTDARDLRRTWRITEVTEDGCWAEAVRTAYVVPGTVFKRPRDGKNLKATVGTLPNLEGVITLHTHDVLIVSRELTPGRAAIRDSEGQVSEPACIGCTLPEVFADVKPGEPIWFDDGKIGGVVEQVAPDHLRVRIERARAQGEKLRGDKGINLPETTISLPALTDQDIEDLNFVAAHADAVALSFASTAEDVNALWEHIKRLGERRPAIVLKVETRRGFANLPGMLLAAMRTPCCGVMIARGDLAVECGFERLAEVQEEMLWVCEAAHVPVVWATQVLESLAKEGFPSRAEITDAAMGHRAECVMLNKGPHAVSAVRTLDNILRRMEAHQDKKRAMLRELHLARAFPPQ
jgi:pyruvate kinase